MCPTTPPLHAASIWDRHYILCCTRVFSLAVLDSSMAKSWQCSNKWQIYVAKDSWRPQSSVQDPIHCRGP